MPDLPGQVPDQIVTSQAPRGLTEAEVASPYEQLGRALDKVGANLEDISTHMAQSAGASAVTRGPDGVSVQIEKAPPIFGAAGYAYQRAVKLGAVAEGENITREQIARLRQKYQLDPAGFQSAAEEFRDTFSQQLSDTAGPEMGNALRRVIDEHAGETYTGLQNEMQRRELANAHERITTEIQFAQNKLFALAATPGGEETPEFKQAYSKMTSLYGEIGGNPLFNVTKSKIQYELSNFNAELKIQLMGAHVADDYRRNGFEATADNLQKAINDPGLNLAPNERGTPFGRLMGQLNQMRLADEKEANQAGNEIKRITGLVTDGNAPTAEQMGALRSRVEDMHNPDLSAAMSDLEQTDVVMRQWRKLTPVQLEGSISEVDDMIRDKGPTSYLLTLQKAGNTLLKNMREGVEHDPLAWADKTGLLRVQPLDLQQPDTFQAQLADRRATAETIASHYGIQPVYFTHNERDILEQRAKSSDPNTLNSTMSVLDNLWRSSPQTFKRDFGEGTLDRLQLWQTLRTGFSPQEIAARMSQADDPSVANARKEIGQQAGEELKKIKVDDIAYQMGSALGIPLTGPIQHYITGSTPFVPLDTEGSGLQAAALKNEFNEIYIRQREFGLSPDDAKKQAAARLRSTWGPSRAVGGALMRYPPDWYYDPVEGSHAWISGQIEQAISDAKGMGLNAESFMTSEGAPVERRYQLAGLVSDAQTEAEIANHRPPSYHIIVTDRMTGAQELLTNPAGQSRITFDPSRLKEEALKRFNEIRKLRLQGMENPVGP